MMEEVIVSKRSCLPPDHLLVEILLRLDVKSLARFRSVSKSWYGLISEPSFRRSYECRKRRNPGSVVIITSNYHNNNPLWSRYRLRLYSLDTKQGTLVQINSFDARHVCHDIIDFNNLGFLFLCDCYGYSDLYSPSTQQLITLYSCYDSIAAFGYVPFTDEYKALSIFFGQKTSIITIGKDNRWRPLGDPPFSVEHCQPLFDDAALVDGAVHLLPGHRNPLNVGIARFDLHKEEWSVLPPLPFLTHRLNLKKLSLRELGGRLCLTVYGKGVVEIWLLKDYKNYLWLKEYNIDVSSYSVSSYRTKLVPLLIEEDDGRRVLLHMTDRTTERSRSDRLPLNRLGFYDSRSGKFEDLNIQSKLLSMAADADNDMMYGSTFSAGFVSQNFMSLTGLFKRNFLPPGDVHWDASTLPPPS